MLPDDWKDIDNSFTFKNKVKKWKDENCPTLAGYVKFTLTKEKKTLENKKKLGIFK